MTRLAAPGGRMPDAPAVLREPRTGGRDEDFVCIRSGRYPAAQRRKDIRVYQPDGQPAGGGRHAVFLCHGAVVQTARKVTAGLEAEIPLIVYNGAAVADHRDGSFLQMNFFGGEAAEILDELEACGVFPHRLCGGRGQRDVFLSAAGVRGECGRSLRRGKTTEGEPRRNAAHTAVRGIFLLHLY